MQNSNMYKLTNTTSIIRIEDGAFIPADIENSDYATYLLWLANGNTTEPMDAPTPAQLKTTLTNAVQAHLDAGAQTLGYDNIKAAATYADEPAVPKFQNEGKSLRAWRSYCWDYCNTVLADVTSGKRPIPTPEELIKELPIFQMSTT